MPASANPMMPWAAKPAPVRTTGGLFDRREVLSLSGERCRPALYLRVGAGNKRPKHQRRRAREPDHLPTHSLGPLPAKSKPVAAGMAATAERFAITML
jgi:hypothetical protein